MRLSLAGLATAVAVPFFVLFSGSAHAEDDLSLDLGGTPLELRKIPKGSFVQGSPASEPGHDKDEEGPRPVSITHDFWIGKNLVTRGQFLKFVTETKYVTEAEKGQSGGYGWDGKQLTQRKDFTWRAPGFGQGDDHPVVLVSYGDAIAFVAWASRKTSKRVRLPTEAEFEYAARARTTTPWPDAKTEEEALAIGWFRTNAGIGTHPVGQKKANAFGLFDMSGHVYEWCKDIYAPYPMGPAVDPDVVKSVDGEPERRVLRGGSWLKDPKRGRSAARFRNTPGSRNADNGFRVVVTEDDTLGPAVGGSSGAFAPDKPAGLGSSSPAPDATGRGGAVAPSNEGLGWLMLAAPIAAAGAVVAWMLGRRTGRTTKSVSGATTRATDDGFFVRVANAAPGSKVRYSCIVNSTEVTDVVPLDGGEETFVYTGAPPTMIAILEIVLAPGGYRQPDPRPVVVPVVPVMPIPIPPKSVPPPLPKRAPPPPPSSSSAQAIIVTMGTDDDDDSPAPLPLGLPVIPSPLAPPSSPALPVAPASSPAPAPPSSSPAVPVAPSSSPAPPSTGIAPTPFLGFPSAY